MHFGDFFLEILYFFVVIFDLHEVLFFFDCIFLFRLVEFLDLVFSLFQYFFEFDKLWLECFDFDIMLVQFQFWNHYHMYLDPIRDLHIFWYLQSVLYLTGAALWAFCRNFLPVILCSFFKLNFKNCYKLYQAFNFNLPIWLNWKMIK